MGHRKWSLISMRAHYASVVAEKMDAVELLEPFLQVIQSGDTNGPITGVALSSVEKFLLYRVIGKFLHDYHCY